MVEGVVAHDVPLLNHTADQVGGGLDHVSHYKEGGRGLMVLQHVQDLGGVAVLISAVKGEVEDLLGRVPHIVGVVLGQGLGGGVAHRGSPSVWKDRPQLSVEAATAAGAAAGTGVSSRTASQNSPPSTRQSAAADSSAVRRVWSIDVPSCVFSVRSALGCAGERQNMYRLCWKRRRNGGQKAAVPPGAKPLF